MLLKLKINFIIFRRTYLLPTTPLKLLPDFIIKTTALLEN